MSESRPETDDTIPVAGQAHTGDATLASGASSGGTVRGPRPSLTSSPDYAELRVVDPAHYALGREIARGGMGRIWVARDRRLGREVALKEVLVDTGVIVRRFEREVRITARLQHPSIVSVHEAGVWPSGEPFYAMRLVSGRSLDEAIASARSFAERLALLPNVLAAADAMAYAHGQRVIHRDLKPRNVVVGDFGETVVIDWGLAKELTAASDDESLDTIRESVGSTASGPGETTAGDILGTPAYMPPEQAAGQAVDERSDVYAIGAMLYHVLADAPPYRQPSSAEVIAAVMVEPPPPLTECAPTAPTELIAIVERAMARDPAARYPTARELAEDLRRFQTGQLVGAHRYSTGQLVRRWLRRHRTGVAALAAAVIVGIMVGIFALERILAADRLIAQESAEARANRKSAEELSQFMIGDLENKLVAVGRLDLLDAVATRAATYYDARGDQGTDEDRYQLAAARNVLGGTFAMRNELPSARAQFDKAATLLADLVARHPDNLREGAQLIRVRYNLASIDSSSKGTQSLRAAVADADRLVAAHPHEATALHPACVGHAHLAALLEHDDPETSLAESQRGAELANELAVVADVQDQRVIIQAHDERGELLVAIKHDIEGALAEYRLAIATGEREAAKNPQNTQFLDAIASTHSSAGELLLERHDLAGAEAEFKAGLAIDERLHRLDPANLDWYRMVKQLDERLGEVLEARHDYAGALAQYRACETAYSDLVAGSPSDLGLKQSHAHILGKIGGVQESMHELPDALASYERSAAIAQALVASDPKSVAPREQLYKSKQSIGRVLANLHGRTTDALAPLHDALAIAGKLADEHPSEELQHALAALHRDLGEVLLQLHDLPAARAELHAALAIVEREPGDALLIASLHEDLAKTGEHATK